MAKTLTLEEAAQQLSLSVEQFKMNLKTHKDFKSIRPLMGGSTMHFREQDIVELARKLGLGSEPEMQLGDASSDPAVGLGVGDDDDQVEIGREPPRSTSSSSSRITSGASSKRLPKPEEEPLDLGSTSDEFIPLTADPSGSKSGKKRDSDAKVQADSGVRTGGKSGVHRPASGTPTEEIDLEAEARKKSDVFRVAGDGSKSGSKSGSKPSSGKNKIKGKGGDSGSEFELQLGADSDSEFELTLADDSDEVQLGNSPRDVSGKAGKSGVKLNKPDDSGISLEQESDSDFELNLDSSTSRKVSGPKSSGKNKGKTDSDSEFELSLDDSSGELASLGSDAAEKDIFATDFDIPALDDSGSEAIALEGSDTDLESSDFDLDDSGGLGGDDSASEVVQLDDDMVEEIDVDLDTDDSPRSKRSKRKRRGDDDDLSADEALADVDEDEEDLAPAMVGPPPPAKWGPLPALVLFPCMFIMLIIAFMGFELMHGMWSYRTSGSKPTYTVTRGVAGLFGGEGLPKE